MKLIGKTFLSTLFLFFFLHSQAQEMGLAGYYSDEFQGRKTASGEPYDKSELTAAHKTFEFGTYVRVTRLDNKKSVVVRINDRGPYIKDRVVDISRKAAEGLDLIRDGRAQVKLEVVPKSEISAAPEKKDELTAKSGELTSTQPTSTPAEKPAPPKVEVEKQTPVKTAEPEKPKTVQPVKTDKTPKAAEAPAKAKVVTTDSYQDYGLYKIQVLQPKKTGYGVQIASLAEYENVLKQIAMLQENHFKNILVSVEKGADAKPVYKIILGPFPDLPTSTSYKESLKKKHKLDGFSVNLAELKSE